MKAITATAAASKRTNTAIGVLSPVFTVFAAFAVVVAGTLVGDAVVGAFVISGVGDGITSSSGVSSLLFS